MMAAREGIAIDAEGTTAVVVLGAAVRWESASEAGAARIGGALRRRARAAARVHDALVAGGGEPLVVATGGRAWSGFVEANVLRDALVGFGVPEARIVRELCSLSTRENALYTARLLAFRGVARVVVVTCAWHLPRAVALFARAGLDVRGAPAASPPVGVATTARRFLHERISARIDGLAGRWSDAPWARYDGANATTEDDDDSEPRAVTR